MWILILFFGMSILSVIAYKYFPVYITPLMVIRCCEQIKNSEKLKLKHEWKDLDDISEDMAVAVWASEDQRFIYHNGIDREAIEKALEERRTKGRIRGASTISQQTAKNVFLWPESSWLRKCLEAYFTVLIETFWDKHRIMEVYLNSIEMGNGIYGAEAVAREHFGCSAKDLTRQQCALIAATLPNPRKYSSSTPSQYILKRQKWVLKQMRNLGNKFPSEEEIETLREVKRIKEKKKKDEKKKGNQ